MWTYFPGPFLAILPKRWRDALPFSRYVNWARATAISGVAEAVAALAVLSNWYSYAMSTWVGRGVETALNGALTGKSGPELRPQDIGGVALVVWASHPLTWLIAYFGLEGALRLGAALTGTGCGTFPFFLLDKVFLLLFGRRERSLLDEAAAGRAAQAGPFQTKFASSAIAARRFWRSVPLGRKMVGTRLAPSVIRTAITAWNRRRWPAGRVRFAMFCGDYPSACPVVRCCSIRRSTR